MDRESPELIEREMEQTRQSLTEKVSLVEEKVVGQLQQATDTVQGTVDSVQETVQTMKSAVQETVQCVTQSVQDSVRSLADGLKETLDVRKHVQDRPLAMVGTAAAAGFVTGLLVFRRPPSAASLPAYTPMPAASYATTTAPTRPGWLSELLDMAGREVKKLAEQALSQASASLKRTVEQRVPKLIEQALPAAAACATAADGATVHGPHSGNGASYPAPRM